MPLPAILPQFERLNLYYEFPDICVKTMNETIG